MNILKAVNLRKIYGQGETEVRALDGINLEVEKGEFVAIVGTSGSGKSTLLHIIGGLDNPTSGQVIVDGQNLSHMTDEELTIFPYIQHRNQILLFLGVEILDLYFNSIIWFRC